MGVVVWGWREIREVPTHLVVDSDHRCEYAIGTRHGAIPLYLSVSFYQLIVLGGNGGKFPFPPFSFFFLGF
nr:MAG TPA: hypothetical protein [Caudoviricetes sp.]